ncbi:MAG: thymidylate synthase, flavin-dependent [Parcubacteria bacterium C7867-005]|nr:MAG: thymidylate synthase, flavin-dependent [Parcubacteria bacterium C7867-005]
MGTGSNALYHLSRSIKMPNVPIRIFNIASTQVDREEVRKWLDFIGAEGYEIPEDGAVTNPALLIALAGRRCYKSFVPGLNPNVTKIRKDMADYIDNILASGHGSVLEHSVYTFAIENVSRVFTGEMNRHRAGWAISEGSMRYIRFTDIDWWMPTSLQDSPDDSVELRLRKQQSRDIFTAAFKMQSQAYSSLLEVWDIPEGHHDFHYKKVVTSCLRRIVGMGVATGGIWTGNIRAIRHVITMRADSAAEEEIFYVFSNILKMMAEKEPMLFGDFKQNESGSWVPEYRKV